MRRYPCSVLVKVSAILAVALVAIAGSVVGAQMDKPQGRTDLRALQAGEPDAAGRSASIACVTSLCKECLYVDTYDPSHPIGAPDGFFWVPDMKHTTNVLENGAVYLVTVQGAVSLWYPNLWTDAGWYYFGVPGTLPKYPSPGITNGKTGWDFQYLFAYMSRSEQGADVVLPFEYGSQNVSIDGGITWFDPAPVGGQSYQSSHVYQFVVEGQGKQAYFRFCDTGPTTDNYGRFYICVQKLVPCGTTVSVSAFGE